MVAYLSQMQKVIGSTTFLIKAYTLILVFAASLLYIKQLEVRAKTLEIMCPGRETCLLCILLTSTLRNQTQASDQFQLLIKFATNSIDHLSKQ